MNKPIAYVDDDEHCPSRRTTSDRTSVRVQLKVIPGSKREGVAGVLGDRLKVKVAAPPEDGKANLAVCRVLADFFEIDERNVTVVSGRTSQEKTVRVTDISIERVMKRIQDG